MYGNQMDVLVAIAVHEPVKDNKETGEKDYVCYYAIFLHDCYKAMTIYLCLGTTVRMPQQC